MEEPHCIKAGPERKRRQKLKQADKNKEKKSKKKDHRKSRQDVEGLLNGVRTKDLIEARLECMEIEGGGDNDNNKHAAMIEIKTRGNDLKSSSKRKTNLLDRDGRRRLQKEA